MKTQGTPHGRVVVYPQRRFSNYISHNFRSFECWFLGQLPRVQAYGAYFGSFVYRTGWTRDTLAKKGHSAAWGSIQCSCETGLHWGIRSPSERSEHGDPQRLEEIFYALI